ncbi:MAG: flavodoxin [Treponema sp.]|nr:flavodoxin [Treponema sp.]
MKTAVVFYSNDGNCTFVAEQIGTQTGADLLRLQAKDEKRRTRAGRFVAACAMVFIHRRPEIKPFSFDPAGYDLIIMGAPVWAASPASPMQTFLSQAGIAGKKIAIFVCHAGGMGTALEKFKSLLPGNTIVAEKDFINPAKNGETSKRQIADWVKTIIEEEGQEIDAGE